MPAAIGTILKHFQKNKEMKTKRTILKYRMMKIIMMTMTM